PLSAVAAVPRRGGASAEGGEGGPDGPVPALGGRPPGVRAGAPTPEGVGLLPGRGLDRVEHGPHGGEGGGTGLAGRLDPAAERRERPPGVRVAEHGGDDGPRLPPRLAGQDGHRQEDGGAGGAERGPDPERLAG